MARLVSPGSVRPGYTNIRVDRYACEKERKDLMQKKRKKHYRHTADSKRVVNEFHSSPASQGFYPGEKMNRGGLSPVLFSLQSPPEPMIGNKRRKNDSLSSSISCISPHL
jgi:hypothetical protein